MSETQTTTPKAKKRARAKLEWLNSDGEVTKNIQDAIGLSHTVIDTGQQHVLLFNDVEENVRRMAMAHGIKQKSTDCASGARANAQDEDEAIEAMYQDFRDGNWRGERGESVAGVRALAEAIARVKGSSNVDGWVEEITTWDEDKRDQWRKHDQVKAALAAIRAEKLAAKAEDSGATLDDLPDV